MYFNKIIPELSVTKFVCLGNICRSPVAEFIFKNMEDNKGISK